MTSTTSPFRRVQDARAAYSAACGTAASDAAWDEYMAAEEASRGYEMTTRERVEMWVDSVARQYRELLNAEAAGGDVDLALRGLHVTSQALADDVKDLRG